MRKGLCFREQGVFVAHNGSFTIISHHSRYGFMLVIIVGAHCTVSAASLVLLLLYSHVMITVHADLYPGVCHLSTAYLKASTI